MTALSKIAPRKAFLLRERRAAPNEMSITGALCLQGWGVWGGHSGWWGGGEVLSCAPPHISTHFIYPSSLPPPLLSLCPSLCFEGRFLDCCIKSHLSTEPNPQNIKIPLLYCSHGGRTMRYQDSSHNYSVRFIKSSLCDISVCNLRPQSDSTWHQFTEVNFPTVTLWRRQYGEDEWS